MKLLKHFKAMQDMASNYLEPDGFYTNRDGQTVEDGEPQANDYERAFTGDIIYMLDGPEQREAQAEAEFDYIAEASLTLSNKFHGEKVTLAAARQIFDDFIRAGQRLDALKKALFYGKGEDIGPTTALGIELMIAAPLRMVNCPAVIRSDEEAQKIKVAAAEAEIILHSLVGIATESVEGIEALYKAIWGDQPIDRTNVLEESGDGFWYHANLFKVLGSDFITEQRRNIAKLRLRFPDNFTEYNAVNRNLDAEREALEGFLDKDYKESLFALDDINANSILTDADVAAARAEARKRGDFDVKERFATRCNACGLENGQHRPECENREKDLADFHKY